MCAPRRSWTTRCHPLGSITALTEVPIETVGVPIRLNDDWQTEVSSAAIHGKQALYGVQCTGQPCSRGAGPHHRRDFFVRRHVLE